MILLYLTITTLAYLAIIYLFARHNAKEILKRWGGEDYKFSATELILRGLTMFAYPFPMTILMYGGDTPPKAIYEFAVYLFILAPGIWWLVFDQLMKKMLNKRWDYIDRDSIKNRKFLDRIFPNFWTQLAVKVLIIAGGIGLIVWI